MSRIHLDQTCRFKKLDGTGAVGRIIRNRNLQRFA